MKDIDDTIYFRGANLKIPHHCMVPVASGHVNRGIVEQLPFTVEREKSEQGLLIILEEPTDPMRIEAREAGFYISPFMQREYPYADPHHHRPPARQGTTIAIALQPVPRLRTATVWAATSEVVRGGWLIQ